MKKKVALLIAVIMLISIVVGCSKSTGGGGTGGDDKILLLGDAPQTSFGTPFGNPGMVSKFYLFSTMIKSDENLVPKYPGLAQKWSVSNDSLTYTFTLRNNLKWHDGTNLTTEDVRWSIKALLKGALLVEPTIGNAFAYIQGADEWKSGAANDLSGVTIDDTKIIIKLKSECAIFLLAMSQFCPLPKHLLEKEEPAKMHLAKFWENPIGSGPYKLTEFKPGNYALLEAFSDYYGPKPKIKKIMLQYFTDPVVQAKSGKLDYHFIMSTDQAAEISKLDNYKVTPMTLLYFRLLLPNINGSKYIKDVKVRQALLYALDRQSIVKNIFNGYATVLDSSIPPDNIWHAKGLNPYGFDVAKAKQLLKEANWDSNNVIRLAYYYEDQQTINLMDTIKQYWGQVGVKTETTLLKGDIAALVYEKRDYDFVYAGWSCLSPYDIYTTLYTQDNRAKAFGFGNPAMDVLIDQYKAESNTDKQKDILAKLQKMEMDNLYRIPLFAPQLFIVENKRLTRPNLFGNEWFSYERKIEDWDIK